MGLGIMEHAHMLAFWFLGGLLSLLAVSEIRRWALAHDFLSIPSARGNHDEPTPLGGGIGIATTGLCLFALALILGWTPASTPVVVYLLAGAVVAAMGTRDDFRALPAQLRLGVQTACALILVLAGGGLLHVMLPGLGVLFLGPLVGAVVAVLWLAWMTNAFNFMDGIDAMSGTQGLLIGAAWALFLLGENQTTLALLAGLLAVASLGFLYLNVTPSLIFMGDAGSTFLGFSYAALPVLAYAATGDPRLPILGAFFVAPVLFDPTVTLLIRIRNHANLFEAHRGHFYQRLARLKYPHLRIAGLYGGLTLSGVVGGLIYYHQDAGMGLLAALTVLALLSALGVGVTVLERGQGRSLVSLPHRSTAIPIEMESRGGK